MKKFRSQALRMLAFGLVSASLALSSCDKEEDPTTFLDPTITVTSATTQQVPGGKVTFTIAVAAEGGLASVKQGDTEVKSYSTATTTDVLTYEYTIPANQALGALTVPFTVTDKQGEPKTTTANGNVTVTESPKETVTVEGDLTGDINWTADKFYLLKGNVYVVSGATLTIEPGTVILGDKVDKGALVVNRGAMIHAQGTAEAPIVFTSSAPKGFRNYGDWGGVVILGNAQNNQATKQKIEGISSTEDESDNGYYGGDGSSEDESSGEFYYVRIEFAGIALSTDNELNGLTMGGVGSGTDIHHVQVSYSGDDSFEWFGGTVGSNHLVAYRGWDDDFDTDFGHTGTHQYLVSFRDPNFADKSGSNGFESDNNAGGDGLTPITAPKFSNVSFFGPYVYANLNSGGTALNASNINKNYQRGAHIRRNSALQVYNSVWLGFLLDGFFFEKTNANAVVKGNYLARTLNANAFSVAADTPYDASNFTTDNTVEANLAAIDLSSKFAAIVSTTTPNFVPSLSAPNALLASGSSLLEGAVEVPAGLEQTDYIGAFDAANNWLTGWTNFDPNNADYGN